jgi:hypothetical protein
MAWSTTQLGLAMLNARNFPFKLSAVTYLRKSRLFHYFSSNEPEAQLTWNKDISVSVLVQSYGSVRRNEQFRETESCQAFESNVSRSILSDNGMPQCLNYSFGPCVRITAFRKLAVLPSWYWNSTRTFLLSSKLRWSHWHILNLIPLLR